MKWIILLFIFGIILSVFGQESPLSDVQAQLDDQVDYENLQELENRVSKLESGTDEYDYSWIISSISLIIAIVAIFLTRKQITIQIGTASKNVLEKGIELLRNYKEIIANMRSSLKGNKVHWNESDLLEFFNELEIWILNVKGKILSIDDAYQLFYSYFDSFFEEETMKKLLEKKHDEDKEQYENIFWLWGEFTKIHERNMKNT